MVDDHALDAHADLEHLLDVGHAIVGDLGDVEQGADAVHIHEGSVGLDGLDFAFKKITPADGRHLLLEDGTAVRHDQLSQLRVHLQELDAEGLAHKIVVELGGQVRARHEAADALNVHEAAAAVRPEHSGVHDHILRLVLDHAVPGLAELDLLDGDKQLARDLVLADDFKLALLPDAHDVLHGAHRAEARLLLREQRCRLGPDLDESALRVDLHHRAGDAVTPHKATQGVFEDVLEVIVREAGELFVGLLAQHLPLPLGREVGEASGRQRPWLRALHLRVRGL
mmetsp:Transcript_5471/g.21632  ORF Transcript_5471/g.21632 Transcript_5471/m.21632 type:complete len:283 (-) Transcript_5471:187-1035(-)